MPQVVCPICDRIVKKSEYIDQIFRGDNDAIAGANLVTHYRHLHLKSYDYAWRNTKDKKTGYTKKTHEEFRIEANNKAKLELIEALQKKGEFGPIRGLLKMNDNNQEVTLKINNILNKK